MALLDLLTDPSIAASWAEKYGEQLEVIPVEEVRETTTAILRLVRDELATEEDSDLRYLVEDVTRAWSEAGVTPRQMSRFLRGLPTTAVITVEEPDPIDVTELNEIVDDLLLWSLEARMERLHTIVDQQREEMEELSTPFIELYRGIAVLPLIGTLDSERAERVMETLLQGIAENGTRVVVLDITGVPSVDTFVAERIVKSVTAARMMGAHCILSGLGPNIALTMVRLGVELHTVETTARLSSALEMAFERLHLQIVNAERSG